jgi:hypothetical protein
MGAGVPPTDTIIAFVASLAMNQPPFIENNNIDIFYVINYDVIQIHT